MTTPFRKSGVVLIRLAWSIGHGDALWDKLLSGGLAAAHVAIAVLEDSTDFPQSDLDGRRIRIRANPDAPFVLDVEKLARELTKVDRERGGRTWKMRGDTLCSSELSPSEVGADEVLAIVQAVLVGNPRTCDNMMAAYEEALGASDMDRVGQVLRVAEQSFELSDRIVRSSQPRDEDPL